MASIGLVVAAGTPVLPPPLEIHTLYEEHASTVYRAALRITGNAEDAEDALQAVFLRLMNQPELAIGGSPEPYLRRAAANAAIDILRRKRSQRESPIDLTPEKGSPARDALLKESLRRALGRLDPEDAALFSLRNLEGFSYDELADMFSIERGTVASRLHRIRQDLMAYLSR